MVTRVAHHVLPKEGLPLPPKEIINKDDVLEAAISLVRAKGKDSINARSLADVLNCSTKPLFRLYNNMEELKEDVFQYADAYLGEYLLEYQSKYDSPLLNAGLAFVDFAKKEKNLFKLIYLSDNFTLSRFEQFVYEDEGQEIFNRFFDVAKIEKEAAKKVYSQLLIYTHGIATLVATNNMDFSEDQIIQLLVNAYFSFLDYEKNNTGKA